MTLNGSRTKGALTKPFTGIERYKNRKHSQKTNTYINYGRI